MQKVWSQDTDLASRVKQLTNKQTDSGTCKKQYAQHFQK